MNNPAPDGWNTVTPRIVTEDVEGLVTFIKHSFQASGDYQAKRPRELVIGNSIVMVSGVSIRRSFPAFLYVYVDDVDACYQRALDHGALSLEAPLETPYGDRRSMVEDNRGNIWQVASSPL